MESEILEVTDEFFAAAANLLNPKPPVARPGFFTETGAWYDGWESRRHNPLENEHVIFKLKYPGSIKGVDMDCTTFNIGNSYCFGKLEGAVVEGDEEPVWETIIAKSPLTPSSHNFFCLHHATPRYYNLLRLNAYPDGGLNRLRVYGSVRPPSPSNRGNPAVDLAFVGNGGRVIGCSNAHFSNPHNLLLPGRGENMGDGWETSRSRVPYNSEWVVLKLGAEGVINEVLIDTKDFKGNYPQEVEIHAVNTLLDNPQSQRDLHWTRIGRGRLRADSIARFSIRQPHRGVMYTHLKIKIFPDGGLKRVRALGFFEPSIESADLANELQQETETTAAQENEGNQSQNFSPYNLRARRTTLDYGQSLRKRRRQGTRQEEVNQPGPARIGRPASKRIRN